MEMDKNELRHMIARRVAQEFKDGDVVTLGIGMPTLASNYIPKDVHVFLQSENGILGASGILPLDQADKSITDAGGNYVSIGAGGCFFDSLTSFSMIRGGHINTTVLGALQVDEEGNLANWLVPGKIVPGMGGAMDLVVGAQKVIVMMEHTAKGAPKILKKCTLPLTAINEVDMIITEKCVMERKSDGLWLKEINKLSTLDEIYATTEANFKVASDLKTF